MVITIGDFISSLYADGFSLSIKLKLNYLESLKELLQ